MSLLIKVINFFLFALIDGIVYFFSRQGPIQTLGRDVRDIWFSISIRWQAWRFQPTYCSIFQRPGCTNYKIPYSKVQGQIYEERNVSQRKYFVANLLCDNSYRQNDGCPKYKSPFSRIEVRPQREKKTPWRKLFLATISGNDNYSQCLGCKKYKSLYRKGEIWPQPEKKTWGKYFWDGIYEIDKLSWFSLCIRLKILYKKANIQLQTERYTSWIQNIWDEIYRINKFSWYSLCTRLKILYKKANIWPQPERYTSWIKYIWDEIYRINKFSWYSLCTRLKILYKKANIWPQPERYTSWIKYIWGGILGNDKISWCPGCTKYKNPHRRVDAWPEPEVYTSWIKYIWDVVVSCIYYYGQGSISTNYGLSSRRLKVHSKKQKTFDRKRFQGDVIFDNYDYTQFSKRPNYKMPYTREKEQTRLDQGNSSRKPFGVIFDNFDYTQFSKHPNYEMPYTREKEQTRFDQASSYGKPLHADAISDNYGCAEFSTRPNYEVPDTKTREQTSQEKKVPSRKRLHADVINGNSDCIASGFTRRSSASCNELKTNRGSFQTGRKRKQLCDEVYGSAAQFYGNSPHVFEIIARNLTEGKYTLEPAAKKPKVIRRVLYSK